MSLSKEILHGSLDSVRSLLEQGAATDIVDEYRYTPLIHAIGAKKFEFVPLLLHFGASVNFADPSGSTPLHWAVDIGHIATIELLIQHGANVNAYNRNGQPILFYPTIRRAKPILKLLLNAGASTRFCQDYILSKTLAHRFELKGYADIVTPEDAFLGIELEGFYLEFTLDILLDSITRFTNSFAANKLKLPKKELSKICASIENASHLRQYKHFSLDIGEYKHDIGALLKRDLLLIPVTFMGHAITCIKHDNLWAKCDRGVSKMTTPIQINTIGNPKAISNNFLFDLIYSTEHRHAYINEEMGQNLQLEPYASLPIKHQITGNCSWANVESAIPCMLYMLMHDYAKTAAQKKALTSQIMQFYQAWLQWDKDRAIEDAFFEFEELNERQQKARAALLGTVLFQSLKANNALDVRRAKKILNALKEKRFHYIVKAFAKHFLDNRRTQQGQNLHQLLNACGTPLSFFTGKRL